MNKKGQALVEFILILPILIFIILALVDIGKLNVMKMHLEGVLNNVSESTEVINDNEYDISINKMKTSDGYLIELKSCISITTPGLNKILGNPACVKTSKIIGENYEEN